MRTTRSRRGAAAFLLALAAPKASSFSPPTSTAPSPAGGATAFRPAAPSMAQPHRRPSSSSRSPAALFAAARKVEKTDAQWRESLSPDAYYVLRREGTEPPWSSELNSVKSTSGGTFVCAGCASPLFPARTKYDSGTGWPSFYDPVDTDAVDFVTDFKLVVPRTEVRCKSCGGHLGHMFPDGPEPTGMRYCLNGLAMEYVSMEDDPELAAEVERRSEAAAGKGGGEIAVKPPVGSLLPGIALNGAFTVLLISSFLAPHPPDANPIFEYFPLAAAAYTGYVTVRDVSKLL